MSIAVAVENVTKKYRLGTLDSNALQADVTRWWARMRGRPDPLRKLQHEQHERRVGSEFWALNDVSFEIKEGEVVGVVGRNGAGKSTLFKILSQVTSPTSGRVTLRGRVASLLEVGTGFHPDLTGRENVFLNGAILGMTKAEIAKNFDAIVAFSECEEFIDTPVKRYSSGMYVRLAFAVAAHLESEILIIDEVLAVGDSAFQKKCLGKMHDIGEQGRTVLFVSHSMESVTRLCNRAILLRDGELALQGPVQKVADAYLSASRSTLPDRVWDDDDTAPGNDIVRLRSIHVRSDNDAATLVDIRKPVSIQLEYEVLKGGSSLVPTIGLADAAGVVAFRSDDCGPEWLGRPRPAGRYVATCKIPGNFLAEGTFSVGVAILSNIPSLIIHLWAQDIVGFQVIDYGLGGTARGHFTGQFPGVVRPLLPWTTEYSPAGR